MSIRDFTKKQFTAENWHKWLPKYIAIQNSIIITELS